MLVLTRKSGEAIRIGDDIRIFIVDVKDNQVKIGVEAPLSKAVHREEIYLKIQEDNIRAASMPADLAEALKGIKKK